MSRKDPISPQKIFFRLTMAGAAEAHNTMSTAEEAEAPDTVSTDRDISEAEGRDTVSTAREAHEVYRRYHRHHQEKVVGHDHQVPKFAMFHRVSKTGVIYATSRASVYGFHGENPDWSNMGQGAPETGALPGSPPRDFSMTIPDAELEYAPVSGLSQMREKVAQYYNHLYRQGKESKYSVENICIVPGGRAGLTRIMAVLGNVQIGYFSPDYSAYSEELGLFLRISPSPLLHRDVNEALMPPEEFEFQLAGRGVGAVLMSNPANPTGQVCNKRRLFPCLLTHC